MNKLTLKLLLPLILLSLLSLGIAYLFDPTLDYASIFLNLATDLIMVIVTIYYVNEVLKSHEEERWFRANYSILTKIAGVALALIEQICVPLGVYSNEWVQEMGSKVHNQRGTPQSALFLYFIRKISKKTAPEVRKLFELSDETQRSNLAQAIHEYHPKMQNLVDLYGVRLTPEVLEKIMETQSWIESFPIQGDNLDPWYLRTLLIYLADLVEVTGTERLDFYMDVEEFRDEITGRKYPV